MSRTLQWVIGIGVVLVVAAVIFSAIATYFLPRAGWTGPGMMGPGHMLGWGGMMGGWGLPFFGLGMLLWPLLIVGAMVLGGVWLARSLGTPAGSQPSPNDSRPCSHCGKSLEAAWKACPYCGEPASSA